MSVVFQKLIRADILKTKSVKRRNLRHAIFYVEINILKNLHVYISYLEVLFILKAVLWEKYRHLIRLISLLGFSLLGTID